MHGEGVKSDAPLRGGEDDFRHLTKIPQRPFDALGGIWHLP
jgi:hypothetical protein